jgi:Stress responsive A/B Barrel Domain
MLAHNVYFTLHDGSEEAIKKLLEACNTYLKDHPGVDYFAAGELVPDLNRPVNDLDFHVGLHVMFKDRASHDQYQVAPDHLKFIAENKESWKQVRVFDSTDA